MRLYWMNGPVSYMLGMSDSTPTPPPHDQWLIFSMHSETLREGELGCCGEGNCVCSEVHGVYIFLSSETSKRGSWPASAEGIPQTTASAPH